MAFADDIYIFATKKSALKRMITELKTAFTEISLNLNVGKCQWCATPRTMEIEGHEDIWIGGKKLQQADPATGLLVLGSMIPFDGSCGSAFSHRIVASWREFWQIKDVIRDGASTNKKKRHPLDSSIKTSLSSTSP